MPKSKRRGGPAAAAAASSGQNPKKHRKMHSFSKLSTTSSAAAKASQGQGVGQVNENANAKKKKKNGSGPQKSLQKQQKNQRPVVPFGRKDRILLVGEGGLNLFFFPFLFQLSQLHCVSVGGNAMAARFLMLL